MSDYRRRDRLGRLEPRNIFKDAGLLVRWMPPGLFAKTVPPAYLIRVSERYGHGPARDVLAYIASVNAIEAWEPDEHGNLTIVLCPCGALSNVASYQFTGCVGECGRVFLAIGDDVRVHRWEP